MRHAVLGAGGIGGLLGAALARVGAEVVLLMRPEALGLYDGRLAVESAVLGNVEVEVPATPELEGEIDVLWVAVKATQLEPALARAPSERVAAATVVPLLNGVDHVGLLRARYRDVVAGAIRVESERVAPARIRQTSPFLRVELAGAEPLAAELCAAGIETRVRDDEQTLLWEKLAFLAPLALATTALGAPLRGVREDERYRRCQDGALAVARVEGAQIDAEALQALAAAAPDAMQSSMQKDVASGRQPELDAIAARSSAAPTATPSPSLQPPNSWVSSTHALLNRRSRVPQLSAAPELDHVLVAVSDLTAAAEEIEGRHGLPSIEGGRHRGWGTANRIVPLGDAYLELVAVVDETAAAKSTFGRWVLAAHPTLLRPLGWAVRTRDLDEVARRLGLRPEHGSRDSRRGRNAVLAARRD
jgi:2-dehydropantoate 2-reductase